MGALERLAAGFEKHPLPTMLALLTLAIIVLFGVAFKGRGQRDTAAITELAMAVRVAAVIAEEMLDSLKANDPERARRVGQKLRVITEAVNAPFDARETIKSSRGEDGEGAESNENRPPKAAGQG